MNKTRKAQLERYDTMKRNMFFFIAGLLSLTFLLMASRMHRTNSEPGMQGKWLGIETVELNRTIKKQYNITASRGLLVTRVFIGSPAAAANIKNGDIISKWNGKSITSQKQFGKNLSNTANNKTIRLTINRQGQQVIAALVPGVRPGAF
ncbi:MAG: PDZ domain-containing protein [Fibrobacteria bacterium]|nr:PDZ domain-containing protein [Fibrobacteria bacterium]